jgi:hypothetical protein
LHASLHTKILAFAWHNQCVGNKFPNVLHLNPQIIFLIKGFHDLIPAIVAGGNDQVCSGFGDLTGFDTSIEYPFACIGQRPGTTPGTTTVCSISIWVQLTDIITTGTRNRSPFLEICLTKGFQGLAAVVAWIVIGHRKIMYRFIQLYFSLFNIFEQQIKNGDNLELFECFRVPSVQPGPGCKIGMASLGEEEDLTIQPPHVVNNATDNRFH